MAKALANLFVLFLLFDLGEPSVTWLDLYERTIWDIQEKDGRYLLYENGCDLDMVEVVNENLALWVWGHPCKDPQKSEALERFWRDDFTRRIHPKAKTHLL